MNNEQIIQIAIKHLLPYDENDELQWWGKEEQLLEFAREIFEKGQQEEIRRQKTGIGYVNGMLVVDEF